ncbi:MAG TPA: hypothetical protein VJV75_04025 [Candidatus Polarisedimenticolia bacterium]|nr:hypothetical protein [Candidatus Polarisedimenticolia bacterium]
MRTAARLLAVGAVAVILAISPLSATILKQMNLAELAGNANRIFSGTVVEVNKGTLKAGGGTIATVTYRVMIDEALRGSFDDKEGRKVVDLRMITDPGTRKVGNKVSLSGLPQMPDIRMGQRYLFFTTAPSAVGLSTTVGLGQGCFRITGDPGQEITTNEFDNLGLFRGMSAPGMPDRGPIEYSKLKQQVDALLGRK